MASLDHYGHPRLEASLCSSIRADSCLSEAQLTLSSKSQWLNYCFFGVVGPLSIQVYPHLKNYRPPSQAS